MNQSRNVASKTGAQALLSRPIQVEDLSDRMDEVAEKVRSGDAQLRVVAYPWGVEFDLVEGGLR